ncbi:MAG: elongation factor P [Patescibacteria group bacterium]
MLTSSDFKNGLALLYKGDPWVIVGFQHVKPGKGGAFIRTKLKNLKNGKVLEETFRPIDQFEDPDVSRRKLQFLYGDEQFFFFMDDNYEQYQINKEVIGDYGKYLKEECKVDGYFMKDTLFNIELPPKMDFTVTDAPPGIKGDTAGNASKKVTIETGAEVDVPLFINKGDVIRINTETGAYASRA